MPSSYANNVKLKQKKAIKKTVINYKDLLEVKIIIVKAQKKKSKLLQMIIHKVARTKK